jgi:hypothetical protein
MKIIVFLVPNVIDCDYFLCKHNGNYKWFIKLYMFVIALWHNELHIHKRYFWNKQPRKARYRLYCQVVITFFCHNFHQYPSGEWVTLKLWFCTVTPAWIYFTSIIVLLLLLLLLLLLILLFIFYIRAYRDTWTLLVLEFFLVISESTRLFPLLISLRLIYSFLLQSCCAKMLTSLAKAWLHENKYCANLW